jgi:hypothetical protein
MSQRLPWDRSYISALGRRLRTPFRPRYAGQQARPAPTAPVSTARRLASSCPPASRWVGPRDWSLGTVACEVDGVVVVADVPAWIVDRLGGCALIAVASRRAEGRIHREQRAAIVGLQVELEILAPQVAPWLVDRLERDAAGLVSAHRYSVSHRQTSAKWRSLALALACLSVVDDSLTTVEAGLVSPRP